MAQKLEATILEMLDSSMRVAKTSALVLGGTGGDGGGVGGPPGGFVGQLPQYRVAYDVTEASSSGTLPSGVTGSSGWSLVDNLNHIRYRLDVLESGGSIVVWDDDNNIQYLDVTDIHFSGAGVSVVDVGSGVVRIEITATGSGGGISDAPADGNTYGRNNNAWVVVGSGGGDSTYLRLDTANDPITNRLDIIPTASGRSGLYIETEGDSYPLDVEQYSQTENLSTPTIFGYRVSQNTANLVSDMFILRQDSLGTGTITGNFLSFREVTTEKFSVDKNGNAYSQGSLLITDAPSDGSTYGRKDAGWIVVGSGGGTSITVKDISGTPSVSGIDTIIFSGATVTDMGSGDVLVIFSGGSLAGETLHIYNEDHSSQSGPIYTTTKVYSSGTLRLYYNGIRQRKNYHYTEIAGYTTYSAMFTTYSGDVVIVDYDYLLSQQSAIDPLSLVDSLGEYITDSDGIIITESL